jgi:amino acid transporter
MSGRDEMRLWPLVATTYLMVSGGPYGLEELVASGYPTAVTVLLLVPVVWSVPTAFMVGELASALPEEGGYYAWVRRALGPFWGFQEAWLSLVASVFDMAIYPTLFCLYLGRLVPPVGTSVGTAFVGGVLVAGCALWNLRGAASVGRGSLALTAALLAPFAVFSLVAPFHRGLALPPVRVDARTVVATAPIAMWNYMGWDNASTIAGEVDHPQRTYPRAVLSTLALVIVTYVVPVAAAWAAHLDPSGWDTGAWVGAARDVGGRALALGVIVGGIVCGAGMFNALLLSYSRVPPALAADGYLPRALVPRGGPAEVPRVSIIVCSIAYAACLGLGFERLVELDVLFYGVSLLLEFVALVVLRLREPSLARPFRVPGGLGGAVLAGVLPMAMLAYAAWQGRDERVGPMPSLAFAGLVMACGPLVYVVAHRLGRRAAAKARRRERNR